MVQDILFSFMLYKKAKKKICGTINVLKILVFANFIISLKVGLHAAGCFTGGSFTTYIFYQMLFSR